MKLERLPKGTIIQVGDIFELPDGSQSTVTQDYIDYWKSQTGELEQVQIMPFYRQIASIIL